MDTTLVGTDTTAPYSVTWDSVNVANGSHTLTSKAYDGDGRSTASAPVTVETLNRGNARYDSVLKAPRCDSVEDRCDTWSLVKGRAQLGPELNTPNTLDGCADGTQGTYRGEESIERIRVIRADGQPMVSGQKVRLEVDVWSYSSYADVLDLYYTADATHPTWIHLTSMGTQPFLSLQRLAVEYVLPVGSLQAVRANFRFEGSASPCSPGTRDDHDDLVFPVGVDSVPPTATLTAPAGGQAVSGTVLLTASASDNADIVAVDFHAGQTLLGTDSEPPYEVYWDTLSGPNGSHTLTARARDSSGLVGTSPPVTVTVDNDYTAPTVAITAPAQGAALMGTVALSVNATDNKGVTRVDFHAGTRLLGSSYSSPFTGYWNTKYETPGEYVLTARAYDAAGNMGSSSQVVVTVVRDATPPSVSITSPAQGATLSGGLWLRASATDNFSVEKVELLLDGTVIDSTPASSASDYWDTKTATNGSHTVSARATDSYGNVATTDITVTVDNDTTAPVASITSPTNGATVLGTVSVQVSATDPKGVSYVKLLVDGASVGTDSSAPYSFSWNTKTVSNGTHTLAVESADTVGNVGTTAPITVTVDQDTTPPAVAITSPVGGATVGNSVSIQADASDNKGVTRVDFYVNQSLLVSDTTAPYGTTWDTFNVANGSYILTARAYDGAGYSTLSAAVSVNVLADSRAPTVSITSPIPNAWVKSGVTVTATAEDDVTVTKVEFYADGVLITSDTSAPYEVSWWSHTRWADGTHVLTAKAYDNNGRTTLSSGVQVYTDNTAPQAALISPAPGALLRGTVVLEATASDNMGVSKVEFFDGWTMLGSATTAPYAASWNTANRADGTYKIKVKAHDGNGNITTTSEAWVTVDNTPPATALTAPAQSAFLRGTVLLSATASDSVGLAKVEFYAGQTLLGTLTAAPYELSWDTTTQASGAVTLTTRAYDTAGNVTVSAGRAVTVDNAAPSVAITSPANGASLFLSTTVQASAGDNIGVTQVVFYDGTTVIGTDTTAPYSVSWNLLSVSKGTHTLTAKAHDAAGHVTTSAPITVKVN